MNKKRGFIVSIKMLLFVLLIATLIAVPAVIIISDNSRKDAMRNIARRVEDASYRYFIRNLGAREDITIDLEKDMNKIELSGQKPTGGIIHITTDGIITFAIYNEFYCVEKEAMKSEYKVSKYEEGKCNLK